MTNLCMIIGLTVVAGMAVGLGFLFLHIVGLEDDGS